VLHGHTDIVRCLHVLPDGRIVSGGDDSTLRIWSKDPNGTWRGDDRYGHTDWVMCLQALPDGRIVSGSIDGTIRIWDGSLIKGDIQ
jgi:WD40 repeat protein